MRSCLWFCIIVQLLVALRCTSVKESGPVFIVRNGEPVNACSIENSWKTENGAITGHGIYHFLNSYYYVHDADFHLQAKMSWEKLDSTTAIFMLFNNHFGFDAKADAEHKEGHFFFYSPGFKRFERFGRATAVIQPGRPFHFEILRRDTLFHFLIDGQEVASVPLSWLTPPYEGIVGFRPWLNTIRVYDWTIEGKLTLQRPPDFVFSKGEAGYVCFREPAIVKAPGGDLLAFAIGRKTDCYSDAGDMDVVLKTSVDNGKSWGPLQIVWDNGENMAMQPTPIVEEKTGKVILLGVSSLAHDDLKKYSAGKNEGRRQIVVLESVDEGRSWSSPRSITEQIVDERWMWYGVGPGSGIQLKQHAAAGRLVAGLHYIERTDQGSYICAVYSDDGGAIWNIGKPLLSPEGSNECEVAELSSGTLLINARNHNQRLSNTWENLNFRIAARSYDGGHTWTEGKRDSSLVEPACQASLLTIPSADLPQGLLLFSNPPDSTYRINLTVRASLDGGRSWPWKEQLYEGPSAYSDLVDLGRGVGGCLFECGGAWPYEGIAFRTFLYRRALK